MLALISTYSKIEVTIQNPIRKSALSELNFCSCGYFAKEIFKNMLVHASMTRYFMKISLALNSYHFVFSFLLDYEVNVIMG